MVLEFIYMYDTLIIHFGEYGGPVLHGRYFTCYLGDLNVLFMANWGKLRIDIDSCND